MKLVLVSNSLHKGGVAKLIVTQARCFAQMGHEVHLVVLNGKIGHQLDFPHTLHTPNVKDSLAPLHLKLLYQLSRPLVRGLGNIYLAQRNAEQVQALLKTIGDIDHVFVHGIRTIIAMRKLRTNHCSFVLHSIKSEMLRGISPLTFQVRRQVIRSALTGRNIIAASKAIADDAAENFNLPRESIHVIYNGVDTARIRELATAPIEPGRPYICSVGRLEKVKGYSYLLKAFALAKLESHDLVLVGAGDEKTSLESQAAELGIIDKVLFVGEQSNPYKYVSRAELFVLSSLSEGMPMSALEALACDTPVITTTAGGLPELMADRPEWTVPPGDAEALAKAMLGAIQEQLLIRSNSKLLNKRFTVEKCCDEYLKQVQLTTDASPTNNGASS